MVKLKGNIYITSIRDIDKVPVNAKKYFVVRSCKNQSYLESKGWIVEPDLSPEYGLFKMYLDLKNSGRWNEETFNYQYKPKFLAQMETSPSMRAVLNRILFDELNKGIDVVFACYCSFLSMCHISILAEQYQRRGIKVGVIN